MSDQLHLKIARALTPPGKPVYLPTDEQRQIIEAPIEPALVVAGAGSGKTHTMVLRILWLIATKQVRPSEVLGLTFTRKATGELRTRLETGMRALRQHGIVEVDEFEVPEISTYNSYASTIYRQYALLVGREPDAMLLDQPGAFALMRQVAIDTSDVELMLGQWSSPGQLASQALKLANALRDNGRTGTDVEDFVSTFTEWLESRERGETLSGRVGPKLETVRKLVANVERLPVLARLADEYQARKRQLSVIEFSDQVATAAEILAQDPAIGDEIRAQTKLVILDEYQDTSVGQTALFSALFRGHGVMAVGDPKQSIYAWRGASAGNMRRFHRDFTKVDQPRNEYTLSTSWRNDRSILDAANRVAEPLPESREGVTLAARDDSKAGTVCAGYFFTQAQESAAIADWFAERFVENQAQWSEKTGAVLVRARNQMQSIAEALAARGVPYRVIGLGGLLGTPEVVDLNCLLRAASDESAGNELLRLLMGARFELGLADIEALSRLARKAGQSRQLRGSHHAQQESDSLSEALDLVPTLSAEEREQLGLSDAGYERLCEAAELLREVRHDLTLPLVELVDSTIRRSRLEIETTANPNKAVGAANLDAYLDAVRAYTATSPGADINEFFEWLEAAEADDQHTEVDDVPEDKGIVQITTMHSAKGLEWDAVAIPLLNDGKMPTNDSGKGWFNQNQLPYPLRQDRDDLPRFAGLDFRDPVALRASYHTLYDIKQEFDKGEPDSFVAQNWQRRVEEDRRLAYVAITRARSDLWLSSSRWVGRNSTAAYPSPFLHEALSALHTDDSKTPRFTTAVTFDEALFATPLDEPGEALAMVAEPDNKDQTPQLVVTKHATYVLGESGTYEQTERRAALPESPVLADRDVELWPRPPMAAEPLARRRQQAQQLRQMIDGASEPEAGRYDLLIDLLLAEQRAKQQPRSFDLPEQFGASYFHELIEHPEQSALDYARPMPQRPTAASLVGNLFHAWVESMFTDQSAGARFLDGLEPDIDEGGDAGLARASSADRDRLETFKTTFMNSRFSPTKIRPTHVELPIDAPLGGRTVRGKIDAVYEHPDGTVEIVDWKTGVPPRGAEQRRSRELQLMLYAHAYAESYRVPLDRVSATLYYLAADEELRIDRILPRQELLELLRAAEARATKALH